MFVATIYIIETSIATSGQARPDLAQAEVVHGDPDRADDD
jgi:hypothetical protein